MSDLASTVPPADLENLTPRYVSWPSTAGYILYWIIFGIMAGSLVLFSLMTLRHPQQDRKHGYLTMAIVAVAMSAYFCMASHGGDSIIPLYWDLSGGRDVFYARYIDWFVTTPLLLLEVLLLAAVPVGTALWVVFADIAMIVFGLFGAITDHYYRWGYYGIGCAWMFVVFWGLLVTGPRYAFQRDRALGRLYMFFASYLVILWFCYPVVWGLAEGSNTISVTAEIAAYGGLDITAKAIFGFLFLLAHERTIKHKLKEERERGVYDMSLLAAPITSPLQAVSGKLNKRVGARQDWPSVGAPAGDHHIDGSSVVINTVDDHGHAVHSTDIAAGRNIPVRTPAERV
jgi:bacteriorhodopsin